MRKSGNVHVLLFFHMKFIGFSLEERGVNDLVWWLFRYG